MTVHAIQVFIAPDSGMSESEVQAAIDDWVSARVKWDGGDWDATVSRLNTALDGSGEDYLRMSVRFSWDSADKDNTLQKCADKFKEKVAWFRAVYHTCDHDADNPDGCSWEERWNWEANDVSVPASVEETVPDAPTVVNA